MFLKEAIYVIPSLLRQYYPRKWIVRRQEKLVRQLLEYAHQNVPFYQNEAYNPARFQKLADIAKFPVLTKQQARENPTATFTGRDIDPTKCVKYRTSGTTGQRLTVLHDTDSHDYHTAAGVRRFLATKRYLPHYRLCHLRPSKPPKRFFENFGLFRRFVVLGDSPAREILSEIFQKKPQIILGYPVYLRELLRNLTAEDKQRLSESLKAIFTESELLIDIQRQQLEEGFGVPVFDDYSAYETLSLYYECSEHGRHIVEDRVLIEILDDAGQPVADGIEGEVVATSFMERAMPFIRYKLGDRGYIETEKCPCGRSFKTMRLTKGRSEDFVTLPGARRLYCGTFLHMAATLPGLKESYIKQDKTGLVSFYFVPDSEEAERIEQTKELVRKTLFEIAGQAFPLEVVTTDKVLITAAGKAKLVTSEYHPEREAVQPEPDASAVLEEALPAQQG